MVHMAQSMYLINAAEGIHHQQPPYSLTHWELAFSGYRASSGHGQLAFLPVWVNLRSPDSLDTETWELPFSWRNDHYMKLLWEILGQMELKGKFVFAADFLKSVHTRKLQ